MITVIHFENGRKEFQSEEEFIFFVQKIFTENGDEEHMNMPQNAEDCAKYIVDFCGNFEMVYYQPEFENGFPPFYDGVELYSFEVYLSREEAEKDFPKYNIIEYVDNDIEYFSVVDQTETLN